MSSDPTVSRRDFVRWSALHGVALVIGVTRDERVVAFTRDSNVAAFAPNQWLAIDTLGVVTIVAARSEMGQGARTALPMIVAEELGADWASVRVAQATPGELFNEMRTSGSSSVSDSWRRLRLAAASAREMLIAAAAQEWSVEPATCSTAHGQVLHLATNRRLAFGTLVERASAVPVPTAPPLKAQNTFTLLGTRVRRVDTPLIVTGRATFGIDTRLPGMRFAVVARSPRVGGVVQHLADDKARAVPGVMQVARVSTGVAVIATRTWAALQGRKQLDITWNNAAAETGGSREWLQALEASLDHGKLARHEGGDTDTLLAASHRRMEQTYRAPFQAHAAMEPLNCTVHLRDDRCEVWVGTQAPNEVHTAVAKRLGFTLSQVTVHVPLLGGGFGRRLDVAYVLEAVEVAQAAKAPVQVVWTREDDIQHDLYQPGQVNRLTAGLDATGHPTVWRHRVADFNLTMFGEYSPDYNPAQDGDPWGGFDTPYAFQSLDVTLSVLKTPVPTGAWRAVSYPAAVFARESFLDEIAHETSVDPVDLRLSLLPSPGIVHAGPRELPNGDRLRRVLQVAAFQSGWHRPFVKLRQGRRWGRGIACNGYHQRTMVAQVAEVSVGAAGDVRVHRIVCAVDCGQVINRLGLESQFEGGVLWALSAALKGAMTFTAGQADQGNFDTFPVMRLREAPVVEVHVVDSDLPPSGVGEQPVPAVAPAVFNAIFAATGIRIRNTPLRAADLR